MIEEAIVDAYGESEQRTGFFALIEENLALPLETKILGVPATVDHVDVTDADEIVAICRRSKNRQKVPILELPLPNTPASWR